MDVYLSTLSPEGTENWRCLDYNASCNAPQCSNTCGALVAGDTKCRDGGFGSLLPAICDYGTNCANCGPRDNAPIEVVGNDSCTSANNGICEDGAAGSILLTETEFGYSGMTCACGLGTDHTDCAQYGNRTTPVACDAPVALPYSDNNLVGRGSADVGPLVCHQVTYPTEQFSDASWNFASRYNFTQGYSATLSFRMYNRAGNKFLSTAPYRAIIRVYANNVIGPTSAYANNLADPASSQTFDSGYVPAVGDEAEHSSMAKVPHLAAAAPAATHRSNRPPVCSGLLSGPDGSPLAVWMPNEGLLHGLRSGAYPKSPIPPPLTVQVQRRHCAHLLQPHARPRRPLHRAGDAHLARDAGLLARHLCTVLKHRGRRARWQLAYRSFASHARVHRWQFRLNTICASYTDLDFLKFFCLKCREDLRRALRPPRVVFVIGCVSCNKFSHFRQKHKANL